VSEPIDWRRVQRELLTVIETAGYCGCTTNTLRAWRRRRGFPAPVLRVTGKGGTVELWSRSEVSGWLQQHGAQWRMAHRLRKADDPRATR
jgi:predicted DNA-binding transcriptional regulator AlpA